ncbi:MGMT family protein [Streptomyces sp. NPDC088755]|uniref:MGMT family protein n=1 Tax=Streptomyces sp. NPDC088755 TaxID=3365888 RepID=UPI00382E57D6
MSQDETGGGGPGAAPDGPGHPAELSAEQQSVEQQSAEQQSAALPEYAERVLDVADLIPPGRVMTYGDVAEWLGDGGPRQVGRVMALYGSAVPWWRVVRADGALLPGHELRALDHYRTEGTPLREASRRADGHLPRLDLRHARWDGSGDGDGGPGVGRGEETHT